MKNLVLWCGIACILIAGVIWWRAGHGPVTDEQLILIAMSGVTQGVAAKSPRQVGSYLDKGFEYDGTDKQDFITAMTGAFFQNRDLDLRLSRLKVEVSGNNAQSSGHFTLTVIADVGALPQFNSGDFTAKWQKEDGMWKILSCHSTPISQWNG